MPRETHVETHVRARRMYARDACTRGARRMYARRETHVPSDACTARDACRRMYVPRDMRLHAVVHRLYMQPCGHRAVAGQRVRSPATRRSTRRSWDRRIYRCAAARVRSPATRHSLTGSPTRGPAYKPAPDSSSPHQSPAHISSNTPHATRVRSPATRRSWDRRIYWMGEREWKG